MNQMEKTYTNGEYKRLGERIRVNPQNVSNDDLEMLQALRLSYKELLSEVFSTLVKESKKIDKNSICTYRVKRIESIISKLQREEKMQLNRMSDIAGCRCIMHSDDKVYSLLSALKQFFIIKTINDYIESPKEGGYRSLHIIVALPNSIDNKTIEIQLRTHAHHNWATLVEITDLVYGTKIKETGKDGDLAEFHMLLSYINDKEGLRKEQCERIIAISNSYSYFTRISEIFNKNYFVVRDRWNQVRQTKDKFFLIAADADGAPEIQSFNRFDDAETAYFDHYRDNEGNRNIVLTYIDSANFDTISHAYSNYFLTYNNLFFQCYSIMSRLVVDAYKRRRCFKFRKLYKNFLEMTVHFLGMNATEYLEFQNKKLSIKSNKKRTDWWGSIKRHLGLISTIFNNTNKSTVKGGFLCDVFKLALLHKFAKHEIRPVH